MMPGMLWPELHRDLMHSTSQQGCSIRHYLNDMSASHVAAGSIRLRLKAWQTAMLSALLERLNHGILRSGGGLESGAVLEGHV